MPKKTEIAIRPTADEIADMVDRGEDISSYISEKGLMLHPAPNDQVKTEITLSRNTVHRLLRYFNQVDMDVQSAIEQLLCQALDQHSLPAKSRMPVHAPESTSAEAA